MKTIWKKIDGHKTQISSALTLIVGFLILKKIIDEATGQFLLSLTGILLTASIYHAENKKKNGKAQSQRI